MRISYSRPLGQAWAHMTGLLLRPIDLGRWCVLGFTAFLAGLVGGDGAGSSGWRLQEALDLEPDRPLREWPDAALDALRDLAFDGWIVALVAVLVLAGLVVALVLTWVGSRGQFMFLDNLAHRRAEVTEPWRRFRAEGNSLFLWQLVYGLVVMVVLALIAGAAIVAVAALDTGEAGSLALLPVFVVLGTAGFLLVAGLAYVEFFLLHLVVPIMHRRRIGCTAAWGVFGAEFRRRPWPFVLYGLLHLALGLAAGAAILGAGLLTCCIGLLLLAIPYLGTVLTLPLPVFVRYLDLVWLEQFGPGLAALPGAATAAGSGQFEGDGAVVRTEDFGPDTGGDEPRAQDP